MRLARNILLMWSILLSACTNEPAAVTDVLVRVQSELDAAALSSVLATVRDESGDIVGEPHTFLIGEERGAVRFPFSFTVVKGSSDTFRIDLVGYGPRPSEQGERIEVKALGRFSLGRELVLTFQKACLDLAEPCASDQTCRPSASDPAFGQCTPIGTLLPQSDGGTQVWDAATTNDDAQVADGATHDADATAGFTLVMPRANDEQIDLSGPLALTFSAPVDATSVDAQSVRVQSGGREVPGSLMVEGSTVLFRPSEHWPLAATYTLTLSGTLRDSEGRPLNGAGSLPFKTRDGAWSDSEELGDVNTVSLNPQVAASGTGQVVVGWGCGNGAMSNLGICTARAPLGGTWTRDEPLEINASASPSNTPSLSSVSVNNKGHALVTWEVGPAQLRYRTMVDGTTWEPLVTLGYRAWSGTILQEDDRAVILAVTPGGMGFRITRAGFTIPDGTAEFFETSGQPSASTYNYSGRLLVTKLLTFSNWPLHVWLGGYDNTRYNVYADTGAAAQRLSNPEDAIAASPVITDARAAADPAGNSAVVVWPQADDNWTNIYAARMSRSAGMFTQQAVVSNQLSNTAHPQVALDASGRAIAAWRQQSPTVAVEHQIQAALFDPNAGWTPPTIVSGTAVIHASASGGARPSVCVDQLGNAAIAFTDDRRDQDPAISSVWVTRLRIDTSLVVSPPVRLSPEAHDAYGIVLACDARGRLVAAWHEAGKTRSAWFH